MSQSLGILTHIRSESVEFSGHELVYIINKYKSRLAAIKLLTVPIPTVQKGSKSS